MAYPQKTAAVLEAVRPSGSPPLSNDGRKPYDRTRASQITDKRLRKAVADGANEPMIARGQPARSLRVAFVPELLLADAVGLVLATGLAAMMYHADAAIAGEIEPVHQMRVATRRLRATVRLFAGVIH